MTATGVFDLLIVGGDSAAYAAAACAAKTGARTALLKTADADPRASEAMIPDFVWRRLALHDAGVDATPVSARISLFEGGRSIVSHRSDAATRAQLEAVGSSAAAVMEDFNADLSRLWEEAAPLFNPVADPSRTAPLLDALGQDEDGAIALTMSRSAASMLTDYFGDADVRAHFASVALSPFALGGDEPGSAVALASLREPAAWRVRSRRGRAQLLKALKAAADEAGVEVFEASSVVLSEIDKRLLVLLLGGDAEIRARAVMASSRAAAAAARIPLSQSFIPLGRSPSARAAVAVQFSDTVKMQAGDGDATYFIADSLSSFADARDAADEGRIMERMPIALEIDGPTVFVDAPWCPAFLISDGEARDWTEQDRQAFGQLVARRIAPFLASSQRPKRIEVRVQAQDAATADFGGAGISLPAPSHDVIGAAARLAIDLVTHV